ncbi:DNA replication and repair protein RecF [Spirochaetia bacterium]|nr:DNA replication and repair protein RecF [Spirochaetia bacterium]
MTFSSITTRTFRNLQDATIHTGEKNVFLVGENGQGKTNILEAVYLCAYASSFRAANDRELIRTGEKSYAVSAHCSGSVYAKLGVSFENSRKTITVDGKKLDDRKELLSVIPCVVFCHEDMHFVSGAPEQRRWFFDQVQSLYDLLYLDDLRRYRKLLKSRNAVLRDQGSDQLLDVLDPQMVQYGRNLMLKREESVQHFSAVFGPLFEAVSGISGVEIRWTPSWKQDSEESTIAFLHSRRDQERTAGMSLNGPHRDRYAFIRGKNEFASQASTGQRRLLALLLRTVQSCRFSAMTGLKPVLLLDDVLLELDPEKRRRFFNVLPDYDQAFYTFLPGEPYEHYAAGNSLVYTVTDGTLK